MKIRETKFFNVLSIFDVVMISAIIILMAPMLYYYLKFNEAGFAEQRNLEKILKQQEGYARSSKIETIGYIDIDAAFKDVDINNASLIKPGVKEMLPNGTALSEILWVGEPEKDYRYSTYLLSDADEPIRITMAGDKLSVPVRLRLKVVESVGTVMYQEQNLCVLGRFALNIGGREFTFIVETYPYNKSNRNR